MRGQRFGQTQKKKRNREKKPYKIFSQKPIFTHSLYNFPFHLKPLCNPSPANRVPYHLARNHSITHCLNPLRESSLTPETILADEFPPTKSSSQSKKPPNAAEPQNSPTTHCRSTSRATSLVGYLSTLVTSRAHHHPAPLDSPSEIVTTQAQPAHNPTICTTQEPLNKIDHSHLPPTRSGFAAHSSHNRSYNWRRPEAELSVHATPVTVGSYH